MVEVQNEASVLRAITALILPVLVLIFLPACSTAQPSPETESTLPPSPGTAVEDSATETYATLMPGSTADGPFAEERRTMVKKQIQDRYISDEAVLAAMERVPRHKFVPGDYQDQAYEDHPLPIGHGQTISQPYIVALMTELIEIEPGDRVLEIGTGSGYQAAVLAEITHDVYTIEIIPELAARARQTFESLGYSQITAKQADGYFGWEEYAPFDAIIVTAAPDHVPQPLVNQLADGGKMVIPIGPPGGYQSLWVLERNGEEVVRRNWGGVRFVPLTRE